MTNSIQTFTYVAVSGLLLLAFALAIVPTETNAANYAYVDATGEVKSVIANDWMSAIATAPNIDAHSGVLLLLGANDYGILGNRTTVGM